MSRPPHVQPVVAGLLVVLGACSDHSLTTSIHGPEVSIVSHDDGDVAPEGRTLVMVGEISHGGVPLEELVIAWSLNSDPACEDSVEADGDGVVRCELDLGLGSFYIGLSAQDPSGERARAEVLVEVQTGDLPEAIILAPDPGDTLVAGEAFDFMGKVSDAEDPPEYLVAGWESDLDGPLDVEADPDELGAIEGSGTLSGGTHTLTLWVEDRMGGVGRDEVVIEVDGEE